MNTKIISVKFEVDAQAKNPQFSVPSEVCNILGVKSGDELDLVIQDMAGTEIYRQTKNIMSGAEVYGPDIRAVIAAGQRIRVEASRSQDANV